MSDSLNGYAVHPAAAVWPMLAEPDLRRLADDIATNGLLHPVVLDLEGRLLDGRNRLASCQIAGVEPRFVTFDGDPVSFVLSMNNERRHLSLPQRAAATALTLAGHRQDGRWAYGKVSKTEPNGEDSRSSAWRKVMEQAGVALDYRPDLLPQVAVGKLALDDAYKQALVVREERTRRAGLPDDLGALVDAGELSMVDALRRAALPPEYAQRVAGGGLALDEAEHLAKRDERDYREAVDRDVNRIRNFLDGWNVASRLASSLSRDAVLAELDEVTRSRFLDIEARNHFLEVEDACLRGALPLWKASEIQRRQRTAEFREGAGGQP